MADPVRVVSRRFDVPNCTSIDVYLQHDGYVALEKALKQMKPDEVTEEVKKSAREQIGKRLDYIVSQLGDKPFLFGEAFSVADAYLFVILNWGQWVGVELARWPALAEFHARVAARPSVREAIALEQAK